MKRMLSSRLILVASLFAVMSATFPVSAADPIPTDRLLPPEVSVFVTAPSIKIIKSRWQDSLFGKLTEDKEFADFRADIEKQLEEGSKELEKEIGIGLNQLLKLPSGEVSFAIIRLPGKPISIVGFLDFGDSSETVNKLLEKAANELAEQGAKRTVKEVDDTKIIIHTKTDDDEDADDDGAIPAGKPETFAYFVKDSFIVGSTDPTTLEAVLARWDGKHPKTFAENTMYRYIMDRCKNERTQPLVKWYINPIDLINAAVTSGGEPNPQALMIMGFLPTLGVTNLKAIGGSFDLATQEYESISRAVIYVETPTSGLLNLLHFPSIEQAPPKWVSSRTSSYYSLNWDIATAYNAIEAIFDTFQGPGALAKIIENFATKGEAQGLKLNVKTDLIDQLTGRIQVVEDAGKTDVPQDRRVLVALGVKNAAKFKATLDAITKSSGFSGKTRQFRGQSLIEMPSPLGGDTKIAIALTGGNLMLTNNVTALEQVLRGDADQKSLFESAGYRKIAQRFPQKTSIIGYQKQDTQIQAAYELLRSGKNKDVIPELDFTKLPPFDVIKKYLRPSGSYSVPDRNGVLIVSFSLRDE